MAHNLTITADGRVMFAYDQRTAGLPWHKLGTGLEQDMTWRQIMEAAHLDWEVMLGQVYDDQGLVIPNAKQTYRLEGQLLKRIHLGMVTNRWTPLQNAEFFQLMDSVVGAGYGCWETAGALFGGKVVFASLDPGRVPDMNIALPNGETLKTWLIGMNGHAGGQSVEFFTSTVRPVCWNTVSAAKGKAYNLFKARHTASVKDKVIAIRDELRLEFTALKRLGDECSTLSQLPATSYVTDRWLKQLFPVKSDTRPAHEKKQKQHRETVRTLAHEGLGNDGKTLWSWYNGFTEWLDWSATPNQAMRRGTQKHRERALISTLKGTDNDKRERARHGLLELAGAIIQ